MSRMEADTTSSMDPVLCVPPSKKVRFTAPSSTTPMEMSSGTIGPQRVRRSARLAEQRNRASSATINLSSESPVSPPHRNEVIDLITPPHSSSSIRPPLLPSTSSRGDFSASVSSHIINSRTSQEHQHRPSVIHNDYRNPRLTRHNTPLSATIEHYPTGTEILDEEDYNPPFVFDFLVPPHTSLPQRVPTLPHSLPTWHSSCTVVPPNNYSMPSVDVRQYNTASTRHPPQVPSQSSVPSSSQSFPTVLHPPFVHQGVVPLPSSSTSHSSDTHSVSVSQYIHPLCQTNAPRSTSCSFPGPSSSTSHSSGTHSVSVSQYVHPLCQTSARSTSCPFPGPSVVNATQTHSMPSTSNGMTNSRAVKKKPMKKQPRRSCNNLSHTNPGPSRDPSQAQPSTSGIGPSGPRMSCRPRQRPPSTRNGSSSRAGSSNESSSRSSNSDVLIVVDDSDSDDDVIIERWIPGNSRLSGNTSLNRPPPTQLEMDESYARQLQAQYDEAPTITSWSPPVLRSREDVPVISAGRSVPEIEDDSEMEVSIIRDNFDALASRVHRWTRDDATRFLHTSFMAGPPPRNTQQLMDNARRMPATMLLRAIVGGNTYNRLTYEDLLELADNIGPARPQGLSKTVLNRLPVKHFEGNNEDQKCVVCMSLYESNDSVRHLPCTHDFHKDCIDQWFTEHSTCPICRVQVKAK